MDLTTLVVLAGIGAGSTGIGLAERSNTPVWGAVGAFAWALFALGATYVEIYEAGVVFVRSYEPVALLGAGLVALNIYMVLFGTVALFRRAEAEEDMGRGPL